MPFLRNVPGLEAVYRDYAPKGVQFFILYKSLTHPGTNGFVEPVTLQERLRQLEVCRTRLRTTVPMVCDTLDNGVVRALHAAPNSEFVVDADGTILSRKFWHDPTALRAMLAERVGPVEHPTEVAQLDMALVFPERGAPRGKVAPLRMTESMTVLKGRPRAGEDTKRPVFAKLLAEADSALLQTGRGKLYLGFYIDPLYEVHWNNPAGGLSWSLELVGDDEATPQTGRTPAYEHDADVDPREFLVDLEASPGSRLLLTARYTVCADDDSFCMPIEQQYEVELVRDPARPSRAGDWMTKLIGEPMQWDRDGDGKVTRQELPEERAQLILLHFDRDHDEVITKAEAKLGHDMIRIAPGERGR